VNPKSNAPISLNVDGTEVNDKSRVANIFNEYFVQKV